MPQSERRNGRLVGVNHVALEVGSIEEALHFYGELFEFEMRGYGDGMAYIDMGDQFLALDEREGEMDTVDTRRHFGLVVDDPGAVERRLEELDINQLPTGKFDFRDPWGNRIQIVAYEDIQFTKAAHVIEGMDLSDLEKTESAIAELDEKGMAPE